MNNMIRVTIPLPNGKYAIGFINAAHIAGVFSVVEGSYKGLSAIMASTGACLAHVEESPEQIAKRINKNVICDRSDVPAQRGNKKPWWGMGQFV